MRRTLALVAYCAAIGLAGCAYAGPSDHALHVVDGQVVHSTPPPSSAYAAYLRARLALDAQPPRLDEARAAIDQALRADGRDPHLWTMRAEIAARMGDGPGASAAIDRAFALSPGYPPAKQLQAKLGAGKASAATTTTIAR
jgi:predicted Zn-dependent protease